MKFYLLHPIYQNPVCILHLERLSSRDQWLPMGQHRPVYPAGSWLLPASSVPTAMPDGLPFIVCLPPHTGPCGLLGPGKLSSLPSDLVKLSRRPSDVNSNAQPSGMPFLDPSPRFHVVDHTLTTPRTIVISHILEVSR